MNIDNFKPTTVYTIYIAAAPEKVWQALTSAEFSRRYFSGNAIEVDLKVGGIFNVRAPDGSLHIGGEVFECDPPRRLTVSFNVNWPALIEKLGQTLVTYEIEPAGNAVRLTMTEAHDRPIDDDILSGGRQGWPAILSSLKSLLETGKPLSLQMAVESRCDAVALGSNISVSAPFVRRCLTGSTMAPFSHLAHRTGRAALPHPALGQDLTPSPTARRVQACSDVRAQSARKDARVDRSRPYVA